MLLHTITEINCQKHMEYQNIFHLQGGILKTVKFVVESSTYVMAGLIGVLIGMILWCKLEKLSSKHLQIIQSMIYGADYIGAGFRCFTLGCYFN